MRFICLKYMSFRKWDSLSLPERARFRQEAQNYELCLQECGHFFAATSPEVAGSPVLLQLRNGQPDADEADEHGDVLSGLLFLEARDVNHAIRLITDGPFAETTEQLGGYYIIDVPDLDAAIAIAARIPGAKRGTVEVRPIFELPNLPTA
jgi:hypothetical protein